MSLMNVDAWPSDHPAKGKTLRNLGTAKAADMEFPPFKPVECPTEASERLIAEFCKKNSIPVIRFDWKNTSQVEEYYELCLEQGRKDLIPGHILRLAERIAQGIVAEKGEEKPVKRGPGRPRKTA